MKLLPDTLPDETNALQKMVLDYQSTVDQLQEKLQWYEEQFRLLQHQRFGASSETGAPCYLTKFRDSCRHNSFTYAADGRCPERPASATTTHKCRFVITTSLAGWLSECNSCSSRVLLAHVESANCPVAYQGLKITTSLSSVSMIFSECPDQMELFNEAESILDALKQEEADLEETVSYQRKKPGRKPLSREKSFAMNYLKQNVFVTVVMHYMRLAKTSQSS